MTREDITQEELKRLLHYDPRTGVFTWIDSPYKAIIGRTTGNTPARGAKKGYCLIRVKRKTYFAHRLAWMYMEGFSPEHEIDHKNGVRHDNRWDNLRHVTSSCNVQNQKKNVRNKTGFPGVHWDSDIMLWRVQIRIKPKNIYIGCFNDPLEAALARFTVESQCDKWTCNYRSELVKAIKEVWPEFNPT